MNTDKELALDRRTHNMRVDTTTSSDEFVLW